MRTQTFSMTKELDVPLNFVTGFLVTIQLISKRYHVIMVYFSADIGLLGLEAPQSKLTSLRIHILLFMV